MQPFCFEFGDRFFPIGRWQLAFRVYTESNVYTPSPEAIQVSRDAGRTILSATAFAWAGLQKSMAGSFRAEIQERGNEVSWVLRARLPERIKGTATYVRGIPKGEVACHDLSFAALAEHRNDLLQYPTNLRIPVYFLRDGSGDYTFALSEDSEVRGKSFAVQFEGESLLLELHHHEDARKWSMEHQSPTWQFGKTSRPAEILSRRVKLMEERWGLKAWEERADVPAWARRICLVLNLHGAHWTGFIFNDYAHQLEIVRHVCERIDGRHVLAYLPAWDGRYNFNWPRYEPDEDMGGEARLKNLVEGAHEMGVHVIPMMGAQSAHRSFLPPALHDAAFQDGYGRTYVKPVEWDRDRMPDTYRVDANLGHPGFRQFLFDKICGLRDCFGFDGVFLDINQAFHNDPRFHVTEGHRELARRLHERLENFLIFGETWYDGLLPVYPLVHTGALSQWNEIFERYCRVTYHLNHPAPGRGSTGCYDCGWLPPLVPDPDFDIIPAVSFVEDTLARHPGDVDRVIAAAHCYGKRKGIL
ncbi:MAG: hypothetical protein HYU36_25560 [Planctomycetes bacterium]|nr:hypothetical protein [Planctomycetota bacterium]